MNILEKLNTNQSVLGKDILEWVTAPRNTKTAEENEISDKLKLKYVVGRDGQPKNKIYPNVFYYVNHNNQFNPNVYLAYIVRDKLKSPRKIPDHLINLDLVDSGESYKGSLICEWAYFQNATSGNPYYMEGCEIVTRYLESKHPLKREVYYYINQTNKGIRIFRDTTKSPRVLLDDTVQ